MSKDIEKYTNWRAITESDYVTMFIKTWFAFVATLRELYPDISVFAEDGKPRGDRPFTNEYKETDLTDISRDVDLVEFTKILVKLYVPSREKVAKVFPQYFFETFYRMNEQFHYKEDFTQYINQKDLQSRAHIDLRIEKRWTLRINFQIFEQLKDGTYNENIKLEVNLKDIIESIDLHSKEFVDEFKYLQSFYKQVYDIIQDKTYSWAERNLAKKYTEAVMRLIFSKIHFCLMKVGEQIDRNFNPLESNLLAPDDTYMILKQRPILLFATEHFKDKSEAEKDSLYKKTKEDIFFWFIDFVVSLRNALFHEIIDPLDEEWQLIYKNAYLALKELLDATTSYLIEKEVSSFIENQYIEKDNEELFEEIKLSLESEAFDLADYELIDDDLEINQIEVANIDFYDASSVVVNKNKAKFRCRANILVDGRARIFSDTLSMYDKEDEKYYYIVHNEVKFNNAEANVEFEVEFDFDLRSIAKTAQICKVIPSYFGAIRVSLSDNGSDTEWEEIYPDDEIY